MAAGFFFTQTLYIANVKAAASIHQSPSVKEKDRRILISPLLSNNKIPAIQISMPITLETGINSLRNILASITDIIGEVVVPNNAILIASVV